MIIIIILTASYIGDDVRIVYSLANTMRSFSVTDGRTDEQGDSRSRMDFPEAIKPPPPPYPSPQNVCLFEVDILF